MRHEKKCLSITVAVYRLALRTAKRASNRFGLASQQTQLPSRPCHNVGPWQWRQVASCLRSWGPRMALLMSLHGAPEIGAANLRQPPQSRAFQAFVWLGHANEAWLCRTAPWKLEQSARLPVIAAEFSGILLHHTKSPWKSERVAS
jgi:hypothetical protein